MGPITLGLGAFFLAALMFFWAMQVRFIQRRHINRSLRNIPATSMSPEDVRRRELALPVQVRVLLPALRKLGASGRRLTPAGVVQSLEQKIAVAGSPGSWDAERILATKLIAAPLVGALMFIMGISLELGGGRAFLLALTFTASGFFLPDLILRSRGSERQEALQRALPDSLDLLAITVQAGLGFDAAMARVSRQVGGPLGEELHRVIQEMQLGKNRADALRDLAKRSDLPELKSFVLSMVQADVFGIPIGKVLAVQAAEMRSKRRQRAEEKAQKIPVKIVFPLIACIFPSLFIVLLGPAVIQIGSNLLQQF